MSIGRHVVVLGGKRQVGPPHRPVGQSQAVKSLRAGDFVHQMQIDVDQVGFSVAARRHNVVVPNLFGQRARTRSVVGLNLDSHHEVIANSCDLTMRDASISL